MAQKSYAYRITSYIRAARRRWQLSVILPDGNTSRLTDYRTRSGAIAAARLLSGGRGYVEVAR